MLCTKIAFAKQIQHAVLNSFKHFSAPKIVPPRTLYTYVCEYKIIDTCYVRSIGFNILQNMHIEVLNFSSTRCADLVFKSFNPFIM